LGDLTIEVPGSSVGGASSVLLAPSPTGQLQLLAEGDVAPTSIAMLDADPGVSAPCPRLALKPFFRAELARLPAIMRVLAARFASEVLPMNLPPEEGATRPSREGAGKAGCAVHP
jgi:hypothetical protein